MTAEPKVIYDYDPRNLPRKLVAAIGRLIAAGSQTETAINIAIMGCLGLDSEYGMAVTTHMALPLKFHVLKSVAEIRLHSPDSLDDLDKILDEIDTALGKRHDAAHDQWCLHPDTKETYRTKIKARGSVAGELIPVSVHAVEADALAVYESGMKLIDFVMRHDLTPPVAPLRPRGHKTKAARKKRAKAALNK
jgi:hypothetical protein